MRIKDITLEDYEKGYTYLCPACGHHVVTCSGWKFDGNYVMPTLYPSVKITCNDPNNKNYQPEAKTTICHHYIRGGNIEFLADCTHGLKNQVHSLQEITV